MSRASERAEGAGNSTRSTPSFRRGPNGAPQPLFDRRTGAIDPVVAAYWEAHYDMGTYVREHGSLLREALVGKLHVFVGSNDTFHLETSVARFSATLRAAGWDASITLAPGRDHYSIFREDGGLIARIVAQMATRRRAMGGVDLVR